MKPTLEASGDARPLQDLSQELYVSDLVSRHSELLASGHHRRFTSPMDSTIKLSMDHCPEPGSPEEQKMADLKHTYMAIVGGLLWLANVTRFELAFVERSSRWQGWHSSVS